MDPQIELFFPIWTEFATPFGALAARILECIAGPILGYAAVSRRPRLPLPLNLLFAAILGAAAMALVNLILNLTVFAIFATTLRSG